MRTIYLKNSKDYLERISNFFYKYNHFLTCGIRYVETKFFSVLGVRVNEEFFNVINQVYGINNIAIESKIINNDLYRKLFKVDRNNFKKTEIYKIIEYNIKHTKLCFTFNFNYKEDIIKLKKYINKNFEKRYIIDKKYYIYKNDNLCIIENSQKDSIKCKNVKKYKIFLYNNITNFFNEIFSKFNYNYNIIEEQRYKNKNYASAVINSIRSQKYGNRIIWGNNSKEKIFDLVFLPNHEINDYFNFCLGNIEFYLNDYTEKKNYIKLEYHNIIENRIKDDMKANLFESYIIQGNPGTGKTYFFKEIFPDIFKNDLKCILLNNQCYDNSYIEDDEKNNGVSSNEKFPLIADCKFINTMCGKPVCIIFDEFENIIRKEEDILYMKELLDYVELNNLPIFFIFLSNDYKKIKDMSLCRSGRINNKINIDKYSTIPFFKLCPNDDTKEEIFEYFIEKLFEYRKYKDNITISDFKRYDSFLSKLYNIENEEKRKRIIEFTFNSD